MVFSQRLKFKKRSHQPLQKLLAFLGCFHIARKESARSLRILPPWDHAATRQRESLTWKQHILTRTFWTDPSCHASSKATMRRFWIVNLVSSSSAAGPPATPTSTCSCGRARVNSMWNQTCIHHQFLHPCAFGAMKVCMSHCPAMAPKTLCIQDLIQDTWCSIKEMQAMIIEKFETRANHVRTMTDLQSSPTSTTAAVNDLNFVHPQLLSLTIITTWSNWLVVPVKRNFQLMNHMRLWVCQDKSAPLKMRGSSMHQEPNFMTKFAAVDWKTT